MRWPRDDGDRRRGLRQNVEQPTSNVQLRREEAERIAWPRGDGDRRRGLRQNVEQPTSNFERGRHNADKDSPACFPDVCPHSPGLDGERDGLRGSFAVQPMHDRPFAYHSELQNPSSLLARSSYSFDCSQAFLS